MFELTLVPAYGRDYKTLELARKAWADGKDFQIKTAVSPDDGRYTSIRDLKNFPGEHVKIRYNKLQNDFLVSTKTGKITSDE